MTNLSIARVNTLPGTLVASTLYIVKSADSELVELHFSNVDGTTSRRAITKEDIQTLFLSATVASAGEADKLTTARAITLTGDATGTVDFDATEDVEIVVTVDPTQHIHTAAQISDLQEAIDTSVTEAMKNLIHPFLLMGANNA